MSTSTGKPRSILPEKSSRTIRFTITETRETQAHKKSSNSARAKRRREAVTNFVAVDGEGITLPDGSHRYVLLGIGQDQIADDSGLDFHRCLTFLWDHRSKDERTAYVGFFLGYDFVQILRSLPEDRARMLLTKPGRDARERRNSKGNKTPFPVEYVTHGVKWQFDILGTKRFKFRRTAACGCIKTVCEHNTGIPWMYLCDTGPFFQKSFLKTIDPDNWTEPVVSPENYQDILTGKSRRATAVLDDEMRRYNRLENAALPEVLSRLEEGFQSLGIRLNPDQWYGPGQAASAWLKNRAITRERLIEVTPGDVLTAAKASYYGGWFEIMAHGIIPGDMWEYDINSAYPAVISKLPCLEHGRWEHDTFGNGPVRLDDQPPGVLSLVYAKIRSRNNYIGAGMHRNADGNILRPKRTEGWYWAHELSQAYAAGVLFGKPQVQDRWTYIPCDCEPPLREVADIYELRRTVGKKTPLGIACKLVPNSLYGKFAQSVGYPAHANAVYASLITAGCRTMILNAIGTHPDGLKSVMMVATDGVYFRTRHPRLTVSLDLGAWEENHKQNMTLFKPGVYWDDETRAQISAGDSPVFKSRGVSGRDFASSISRIDDMFSRPFGSPGWSWPSVTFPVEFSMITALQALTRNDWPTAGQVSSEVSLRQSSAPWSKRHDPYIDNGIIRTRPYTYGTGEDGDDNGPYEPSHRYTKKMGLDDPFSDENLESSGLTPDGYPATLIREALRM